MHELLMTSSFMEFKQHVHLFTIMKLKLFLTCIMPFGLLAISASLNAQENYRIIYNSAIELTNSGNYVEAIKTYSRAIDENVLFHEAFFSRGYTYYLLNQYTKAINDFDIAIEIKPVALYYFQRGMAYEKLEKDFVAIQNYNEAIRLDTNYLDAIYQRGKLLDWQNKDEEALHDYKKALQLGLNNPKLYYEIGWIYSSLNQPDSALKYYKLSLENDEPQILTFSAIAGIYLKKNQIEEAIEILDQGIIYFPDYAGFYSQRGLLYSRDQNRIENACADFQKALELGNTQVEVYISKFCNNFGK